MAEQALVDAVERIDRLAEEVLSASGVGGVAGRPDPARVPARSGSARAGRCKDALVVAADERDIMIGRAERVVDDRMQHPGP